MFVKMRTTCTGQKDPMKLHCALGLALGFSSLGGRRRTLLQKETEPGWKASYIPVYMCSATVARNAVTTSMAITEGIHKGNILSMEIVRDHSGNTLRVSQSRFYNEKLVQTLLEGHSILLLEASLSGDCDVEKNGKWSCIYTVGSQVYQMVCTRPDIASTDVGMLDGFDHGLQTHVQVFVDFDYAMGRSITRYGFMILGCARSLKANLQHIEALPTTEAG
nr:zinc finger, CCHC-type [Tanacetum cinerariifolium]